MMNGYAMSGWGWLLMTLGMLGFWALVAVVAVALLRRPASPTSSDSPASRHGPVPRRSWPNGLSAASSTPTSIASAYRPSRRRPAGHDLTPTAHLAGARLPRIGTNMDPGSSNLSVVLRLLGRRHTLRQPTTGPASSCRPIRHAPCSSCANTSMPIRRSSGASTPAAPTTPSASCRC